MTIALCIPAYNASNFLPRLLASVQKQAIPFHEILVYDDCSTDDTAEIALKYGAIVLKGKTNKGCSTGKNVLANFAKSEWLHFHDADDDIRPNFTELVCNWIKNRGNDYEVLLLNFSYIDPTNQEVLGHANHDVRALHHDPVKYTIEHRVVNFGIYNRKAFLKAGGFDTDVRVLYNEDNAFHQNLARSGCRFDYLPTITCINYRYSISMSANNQLKCAHANFYVLIKALEKVGNKYPQEIANQLWNCIAILGSYQDWDYVKKSLYLFKKLNGKIPHGENKLLMFIAVVDPFFAVWIREKLIRLTKPHLRNHV